jgi:ATP-binding cassette subfamily C protein CydCD
VSGRGALATIAKAGAAERRSYRRALLLGLVAIASSCALLATSGFLIARASQRPQILSLLVAIVLVRAFALLRATFRYGERLIAHDGALRTLLRLRTSLFDRLSQVLPGGLRGKAGRRAELLSRYVADVEGLQDLYVRGFGQLLVAALVGVAAGSAAALLLPVAALYFLALYGLGALLCPLLAYRAASRFAGQAASRRGQFASGVVEAVEAGTELRLAGRARERRLALGQLAHGLARAEYGDRLGSAVAGQLNVALSGLAVLALAAASAAAVHAGRLSGVDAVALALLGFAAFEGLAGLAESGRRVAFWRGCAARLAELLHAPAPYPDPDLPVALKHDPEELRLEEVWFSYPADGSKSAPLLRGLNLSVERGLVTVLCGPSGSGKTTLGLICARFLAPARGTVWLGGVDIATLPGEEVRRHVLFIEEQSHLFDTTVRNNLLLANPKATEEELWRALAAVGLAGWLASQDGGLELAVGAGGSALSGGQRRRLLVARALLSKAAFVIVDEPTAHLDADNAALVWQAIQRIAREGRGVLAIGHRLADRFPADRTFSLVQGRAVAAEPRSAHGDRGGYAPADVWATR